MIASRITIPAVMTPAWKPPPGPIVAVELHIEREQQDERQDQLGADAQDEVEAHCDPLSPFLRALAAARRAAAASRRCRR